MKGIALCFIILLSGCWGDATVSDAPAFGERRRFAGKIEGNWEYGSFRECGTLKHCTDMFKSCGYSVSESARTDWKRLLKNQREANYWVEFVGRRRDASHAEESDNLDPQECVVEVEQVLTACESSSPIYPDENGQLPECASPESRL